MRIPTTTSGRVMRAILEQDALFTYTHQVFNKNTFNYHGSQLLVMYRASAIVVGTGFVIFLILAQPAVSTVSVTVINEGDYPWLVKGAYADYLGAPGGYVEPNGTLLLNIWGSGFLQSPTSSQIMSLDWTVLSRTGNMAWLQIEYHASGCATSQDDYTISAENNFKNKLCTDYDFNATRTIEVNVATGEAYNGSQTLGFLNFWAPPLISNVTTTSGTAFVSGKPEGVLSNVTGPYVTPVLGCSSAIPCSDLAGPAGIMSVNESGTTYAGAYTFYQLTPATLGEGFNQTVGWFKVIGSPFQEGNQTISFFPMSAPGGWYDYYSGLALIMSAPEYPVPQIVCGVSDGSAVNCEYTTYATSLGTLFRSEGGYSLQLVSTNIPIKPSLAPITQTVTQSSSNQSRTNQPFPATSLTTLGIVGVVAVVVAASLAVIYRQRKRA